MSEENLNDRAEKILNENIWGVHKELLKKHWAFKSQVLNAIKEALKYESS